MAILSAALALTVALAMITAPLAQAQTFNLIYGFTGGADGGGPSVFARDSAGNLYGTAYSGGVYVLNQGYLNDYGTVFKLDRNGKETTLQISTAQHIRAASRVAVTAWAAVWSSRLTLMATFRCYTIFRVGRTATYPYL